MSQIDVRPSQSSADLESKLLDINTELDNSEAAVEKDTLKGGLGAFSAGVFEFFGNWSTDFAMINTQTGIVDVPITVTHFQVPVDSWMAMSAVSHFIALGAVAYSAYKLGKVVGSYRTLSNKLRDVALGIKEPLSKNWQTISKYAVPIGLASYLAFESVVLLSYGIERGKLVEWYDAGIWWNNAALAKVPALVTAALGYYARGKVGKGRHPDVAALGKASNYIKEKYNKTAGKLLGIIL